MVTLNQPLPVEEEDAVETIDSRTSNIGRKRALHTHRESNEANIGDSGEDSSSQDEKNEMRKRVKRSPSHDPPNDERNSAEPRGVSEFQPSIQQIQYMNLSEKAVPAQTGPAGSWNLLTQSALRTSFAKRVNRRAEVQQSQPKNEHNEAGGSLTGNDTLDGQVETENIQESHGDNVAQSNDIVMSRAAQSEAQGNSKSGTKTVVTRQNKPPKKQKFTAETLQLATIEAKEVIDRLGWPLLEMPEFVNNASPSDVVIVNKIAAGSTFYPRYIDAKIPRSCSSKYLGKYELFEIFDEADKPYQFGNFSFSIFLPAFIRGNESNWTGKWATGKEKDFITVYNSYINWFYGHIPHPLQKEILGSDKLGKRTITLKAVRKEMKQYMSDQRKSSPSPMPDFSQVHQDVGSRENLDPSQSDNIAMAEDDEPTRTSFEHSHQGSREASYNSHESARLIDRQLEQTAPRDEVNAFVPLSAMDNSYGKGSLITSTKDLLSTNVTTEMDITMDKDEAQPNTEQDADEAERQLIQRYYPRSDPSVPRCLSCSQAGHFARSCPLRICPTCDLIGSHPQYACPKARLCGKCRQPGHETNDCKEKLLPAVSELAGCQICHENTHQESECHFIWRSFIPPGGTNNRKVRHIPIFCSNCGAEGHYGPQCGLAGNKSSIAASHTWSLANHARYVDSASENLAIAASDNTQAEGIRSKPDYTIKGTSGKIKRKSQTDQEALSDSGNESFIRPKINGPAKNGKINFKGSGRPPANNPPRAPIQPRRGGRDGSFGRDESHNGYPAHQRETRSRGFQSPPAQPGGSQQQTPANFQFLGRYALQNSNQLPMANERPPAPRGNRRARRGGKGPRGN